MATRAYVQPKTIIGNIQYLNPNIETISTNKSLYPTDSSLQCLDPGNNNLNVYLPEEIYSEGMIINIVNSSIQNGVLSVYDFSQLTEIVKIYPTVQCQLICLNGIWHSFKRENISFQNLAVEEEEFVFDNTMSLTEITDFINNDINHHIHPRKKLTLKFRDGTFNSYHLSFSNFYGGGKLYIEAYDPTCHPRFQNSTGNCFELIQNKDVEIFIKGIIIEQHGNNNNILIQENIRTSINIRNMRLINTTTTRSGNGISCNINNIEKNYNHLNINILQTQFGNFDNCVYLNGDYYGLIENCVVALTESSVPSPLPSNYSYYLDGGSMVCVDNTSIGSLGNGFTAKGLAFI